MLSTIPIDGMTRTTRPGRDPKLPKFWRHALAARRGLGLELTKKFRDMPAAEARAIPLFTNPLFNLRLANSPLSDDWHTDLELHRVRETFHGDTGDDYSDSELIDLMGEAFTEHNGNYLVRGNWYGRDTFLRQWRELIQDIPRSLRLAAKGHTGAPALGEPAPTYSAQATHIMRAMGWRGGGLGKDSQGPT